MKNKRPAIADVARVSGVSKSTVSRVLSNRIHYMREETGQRALQAVDELRYRPSTVARSLVSKRTERDGRVTAAKGYKQPYGLAGALGAAVCTPTIRIYLWRIGDSPI